MRKTLALALVASAAVLGFKAYADNHGQAVGNADSNNMLVIEEEGYVVTTGNGENATQPMDANAGSGVLLEGTNNNPSNDVTASPQPNGSTQGAGNAEGDNNGTTGNSANTMNGDNMPNSMTIDETVSGAVDSQGDGYYEVDESVTTD